jgi:mannose-6-phosphate isomerase-like protein (cupin superfamily)
MAITVVDPVTHPEKVGEAGKILLHDSPNFHCWIYGPNAPGSEGPMHKHTADQVYVCVKGQATFVFLDHPEQVLTPGMTVIIPAGEFYQIDNRGAEESFLIGTRAESGTNGRKLKTTPWESLRPRFNTGLGDWVQKGLKRP